MYNRVPTIFMPQMSPFMDDQRTRALSAVERDVAAIVEPNEMLAFDREITAFLDQGKSREIRLKLEALELPEPGNVSAACIIEETVQ